MAFSFQCPACSKELQIGENMVGQQMECPFCKQQIHVPSANSRQQNSVKFDPSPESFFLVVLFTSFLRMLRGKSTFSDFSRFKDHITKAGAFIFLILGVFHLIATIVIASKLDAGPGWKLFLMEVVYFIAEICIIYSCMAIFQQFNHLIRTSGSHTIPESALNIIAIVSFGISVGFLVIGIMDAIDVETMTPLYTSLYVPFSLIPLCILTLAPSNICVSVRESSPVATLTGIFYFSMKAALFAIPFVWSYFALHKISYFVTHLGDSDIGHVVEATGGLDQLIVMSVPICNYVGYLLSNFVYTAILSCIERKKD